MNESQISLFTYKSCESKSEGDYPNPMTFQHYALRNQANFAKTSVKFIFIFTNYYYRAR